MGQPHAQHLNLGTLGTIAMLGATFLPLAITADNLISAIAGLFGAEEGAFDFIPFNSYNYFAAASPLRWPFGR